MTEHSHGSMSTQAHEKTFQGFIKASKFVIYAAIGALVFMALFNS